MKYYFSASAHVRILRREGVRRFLFSYAISKNLPLQFSADDDILIDSGAFTVWSKGKQIDIDAYKDYCLTLPQSWHFVSLDSIPKTGSSRAEINTHIRTSVRNFSYLSQSIRNLIPVHHYGEPISVLSEYLSMTRYVGLSPANDTHGNIKRRYLDGCFAEFKRGATRFHSFGYASEEGLTLYPFYSVDASSFVRLRNPNGGAALGGNKKLDYLLGSRVREILKMECFIDRLWKERGLVWQ